MNAGILVIFFNVVLVNNFIFSRFLGLCPYMGVSRETKPAMGMSLAIIFVMTLASLVTWLVYNYILVPLNLIFLRTIAFILVIATLVQLVEMVIRKIAPPIYRALGIYLPLITTNCAVMGVTVLNVDMFFKDGTALEYSLVNSLVQGVGAGAGFMIAMLLMSGIRERLDLVPVPKSLKELPIAFLTAGLSSLAFMGFIGLFSH
ncbi:MAG: RnfABCDGE type electron transport complex subunit A [Candidatus Omnitrophica bacterium]|nr:RnfABCDGE type electron transport complex subunit A [Candidatus Omnitrophota bacterium]